MKPLIYLVLFNLFFFGCQQDTSEKSVSVPTEQKSTPSGPLKINIEKIEAAVYTKSLLQDQQKILTDRLCKESKGYTCLLYTSPSPRDATLSRMPSSA